MCTIWNYYIRKVIILSVMITFIVLLALSNIIRLIEDFRKVEEQNYSFCGVVISLILNLSKDFELFLPISVLLGGFLSLGIIEIRNEFIIMQISGISKLQIIVSVMKASIPVLLCSVIFSEWILPYGESILYICKDYVTMDVHLNFQKSRKLLWFVDNNYFIQVERILDYNKLLGVTLYCLDKDKRLTKILFIEQALFMNNVWHCSNIHELDFSTEICVLHKKISYIEWKSILTPYIMSILLKHPHVLSVIKLYHCVQYLDHVGQNSKYYQLILWNKLLSPLSGFVMLIVALSCTFGPLHKQKLNIKLFLGICIGFVFYILNQAFGMLSIVYSMSPVIGAMSSTVIFLIVSLFIIWKYY